MIHRELSLLLLLAASQCQKSFAFTLTSRPTLNYARRCTAEEGYHHPTRIVLSSAQVSKNSDDNNILPYNQDSARHNRLNGLSRVYPKLMRRLAVMGVGIFSGINNRFLPIQNPFFEAINIQPASATIQMLPTKEYAKNNPAISAKMNAIGHALSKNSARDKLRQARQEEELKQRVKVGGPSAKQAYLEEELQKALKEEQEADDERRVFYTQLLMEGINPSGVEGHRRLWEWEFNTDLEAILFTDQHQYKKFIERGGAPKTAKMWQARLKEEKAEIDRLMKDNADIVEFFLRKNKILYGREMFSALKKEQDFGDAYDKRILLANINRMEKAFRDEGKVAPKKDYNAIFANTLREAEERKAAAKPIEEASAEASAKAEKKREKELAKERKRIEKEEKAKYMAQLKADKAEEKAKAKAAKEEAKAKVKAGADIGEIASMDKTAANAAAAAAGGQLLVEETLGSSELELELEGSNIEIEHESSLPGIEANDVEETVLGDDHPVTIQETSVAKPDGLKKVQIVKLVKVSGAIGVVGGGGYIVYNSYQKRVANEEEERQRQFNLIMGVDGSSGVKLNGGAPNDRKMDLDDFDSFVSSTKPKSPSKISTPEPLPIVDPVPTPKKKKGIMGSIFSKSSTSRPTDINVVLSRENYPETAPYAQTLAQFLTVGAPGRFRQLEVQGEVDLQNVMDDEGTFDVEKAKDNLISLKAALQITDATAAETFANVVNAMIITLIDLASSATQISKKDEEKDNATVDALNVVLDYMDHAASLFDAVAKDVEIKPVTYEGTLSKSKLEQMYGAYAKKAMMSFNEEASGRLETLQQVFNISDKKAESVANKVMMKNLMKMMKDGGDEGGMEGMAEMLASMGGDNALEGLEGMMKGMGDTGEDISSEDLKQSVKVMKQLVDSGSVSKEELDLVRKQFKEAYGTDISELIAAADSEDVSGELGDDGKELLELFKDVLGEDKK